MSDAGPPALRGQNGNRITLPRGLLRQGSVRHNVTGRDNEITLEGVQFSPADSTALLLRADGDGGVIRIARLRRSIDLAVRVGSGARVEIGAQTSFRKDVGIHASDGCRVIIGADCMFSSNILVRTTDSHAIIDLDSGERVNPDADIEIGDHVWIGEGVRILKGARIGSGSVIGMGSVVTGEVPASSVAAGAPLRVLRRNIRWER